MMSSCIPSLTPGCWGALSEVAYRVHLCVQLMCTTFNVQNRRKKMLEEGRTKIKQNTVSRCLLT